MTEPQSPGARLRWEALAARSAAEFVTRYVKECCRHTEAVSECPHCNLNFLAVYAKRAADYFEAASSRLSAPAEEPLKPIFDEIEKSLGWVKHESFIVDYAVINRGAGGLGCVVEHSTAMHALLFVRQALRAARPAQEALE
jgi:hypothetical protein